MSLYSIATEYNGPLEAGHAHIDDDRYDKDNCYASNQRTSDLIMSATRLKQIAYDKVKCYALLLAIPHSTSSDQLRG